MGLLWLSFVEKHPCSVDRQIARGLCWGQAKTVLKGEIMHYGSIDRNTAAGRLFWYLKKHEGVWLDAWHLTEACEITALSTRISEIRHQLRGGETKIEHKCERKKNYYRVIGGN